MNQWLADFLCGSISGILGTFVGHPLDTVKCRLQVMSKEYSNTFLSIAKIVKEEKFVGLYKGVVPPMINQFPVNAILFSEYYRMYRYLDKQTKISKGAKYYWSGTYSGVVYIIINTPFEVLKCRQQLNVSRFVSLKEVSMELIKAEGVKGFYRGLFVSFNRDVYSAGIYFYTYYKLKDYWEEKGTITNFKIMLAGGISGVFTWLSTYPFDTLKTIIQTHSGNRISQLEAYRIHCSNTNSAFLSLYKGIGPTLFRGFFTNAVIFYTNYLCHSMIDHRIKHNNLT